MHRIIVFSALSGVALTVAACLTSPSDVSGSTSAELHCMPQERAFNGACHTKCAKNADCTGADACMVVAPSESLCIQNHGCAYLGSDQFCAPAGGYGYGYGYGYSSYGSNTSYGAYGGSGCVGNARWQVTAATGDPSCGQAHAVQRCHAVRNGCAITVGVTTDIADP